MAVIYISSGIPTLDPVGWPADGKFSANDLVCLLVMCGGAIVNDLMNCVIVSC